MNLLNIISISSGGLYFVPLIHYLRTGISANLVPLFGMILTVFSSEFIKLKIIGTRSQRPSGATDCDLLCTDGSQQGKPGMPSSHMGLTAFAITYYYSTVPPYAKVALIIYAVLVASSRYLKRCHTINQIIAGTLFGSIIASIFVRYNKA
jgi:hypothetical protein